MIIECRLEYRCADEPVFTVVLTTEGSESRHEFCLDKEEMGELSKEIKDVLDLYERMAEP